MKKIFISQPMGGKTDQEITAVRAQLIAIAQDKAQDEIEILDTFYKDFDGNALGYLGRSIGDLSKADLAVFAPGWEDRRGCRIEHACCVEYGIPVFYVEQ